MKLKKYFSFQLAKLHNYWEIGKYEIAKSLFLGSQRTFLFAFHHYRHCHLAPRFSSETISD